VGPHRGTLLLAGGGDLHGTGVLERFVELAGGPDAHIVVIPTAAADSTFDLSWEGLDALRAAGAGRLTVLHTRDRTVANSERFVSTLREADAVWISGGRQGRFVDAYLGTRTHRELNAVLSRGGVLGGSSAGASLMASYLVRGGVETNEVLMVPGYEEGLAFLRNVAVDQHVIARDRVTDLLVVLNEHPELLGIGLDEGTAIVVRGDLAEVVGRSSVIVFDPADPDRFLTWLEQGDLYDMGNRTLERRIQGTSPPGSGG
jgi:cyanophycinase